MKHGSNDDLRLARAAGIAAILSGICWVIWALINVTSNGGSQFGPRAMKGFELLNPLGNLLLIPAVVALGKLLWKRSPGFILLFTLCGILSLTFWAYGSATHQITP